MQKKRIAEEFFKPVIPDPDRESSFQIPLTLDLNAGTPPSRGRQLKNKGPEFLPALFLHFLKAKNLELTAC